MRLLLVGCVAMFLAVGVASCDKIFPVDVGEGQANGTVLRVDTVHYQVTIEHQEIPNLIQAMTFSYPVKDRAMLRDLRPLDSVMFTLKELSAGNFEVQSIRKIQ